MVCFYPSFQSALVDTSRSSYPVVKVQRLLKLRLGMMTAEVQAMRANPGNFQQFVQHVAAERKIVNPQGLI